MEEKNENELSEKLNQTDIDEKTLDDSNLNEEVITKKKSNKRLIIITIIIFVLLAGSCVLFVLNKDNVLKYFNGNKNTQNDNKVEEIIETDISNYKSEYTITKNSLDNFDLAFLKVENAKKNLIYSPLSIKYALGMLMTGAEGETQKQINDVLGNYKFHKFTNNKNMSFANALFIKNTYKDSIKKTYIDDLKKNFGAEVKYDSFKNSSNINKYVSDNTFNLINNLVGDVSDNDYILLNALAIDMNWVHRLQTDNSDENGLFKDDKLFSVNFSHLDYSDYIGMLSEQDYHKLAFNGDGIGRQSVEIGAVINNYDIVGILGEDKIKKTVMDDYNNWIKSGAENACEECDCEKTYDEEEDEYDEDCTCKKDTSFDFNKYLKELDKNYGTLKSSTDFELYIDDNFKVFKKDLRKYDNTTLQYVGIMPTKMSLQKFISDAKEEDINKLIKSTKKIESKNFNEGVITEVSGYIPLFKFDYELNLVNDLNKIGITDVFDSEKADLSRLTSSKSYINNALHKATIEFTNDGIKAAAVTEMGGRGSGDCGYDYLFIPPVERIDMTFDKPFLFLVIDKNTEEVWFIGTVYEPDKYKSFYETYKELHPEEDDEDE